MKQKAKNRCFLKRVVVTKMLVEVTVILLTFCVICGSISFRGCDIRDFGATATFTQPDVSIANNNAAAILKAFQSAAQGACGLSSRTVYIPKTFPFYFTSIYVRYKLYNLLNFPFSSELSGIEFGRCRSVARWHFDCSFQNIVLAKGRLWKRRLSRIG